MCNNHSHFNNRKLEVEHTQEHDKWNRRTFLQMLGLAGTGTMMLGGSNLTAANASPLNMALADSDSDKILLLIRLKGGNDGLNTIVPLYDYDIYAQKRPTLRIPENKLYKLSNDFGIDSSLNSFKSLWGDGKMKIAHGVGYNEYNMSHFSGADIWATGDNDLSDEIGVFGKYFQNKYPDYLVTPPKDPAAIQIGSVGNLIFNGEDTNYAFTVSDPKQLESIATTGRLHDTQNLPGTTYGKQLGFMRGLINSTMTYAKVINEAHEASTNAVEYGTDNFAKQLSILARMIKGGIGTKIFLVTMDGFDTHADQTNRHKSLMQELSDGVKNFYDDLEASGDDKRVLAMTFSEFGRRIEENGSKGTDHGAASSTMIFGPGLEGNGFISEHPDLNDIDELGNLKYNLDFRSLYSTVLKDWLSIDGNLVDGLFPAGPYETQSLGFSSNSLSTTDFSSYTDDFSHVPTYSGRDTFIEYNLNAAAKVSIQLYNMVGQHIGTIANNLNYEGRHKVSIKENIKSTVMPGEYLYTIQTGGKRYSKLVMIN